MKEIIKNLFIKHIDKIVENVILAVICLIIFMIFWLFGWLDVLSEIKDLPVSELTVDQLASISFIILILIIILKD